MSESICILAKAPVKGKVKTRLAASIGEKNALALYVAMLRDTKNAALATGFAVRWWIEGPEEEFGSLLEGCEVKKQPTGDLGERISAALRDAAGRGETGAVIGADCPRLGKEDLTALFMELDFCDCAIIPSPDGGFCALALKEWEEGIFKGVEWSSPRTLSDLIENIAALGKKHRLLPPLEDIDDAAALERLRKDILSGHSSAPFTAISMASVYSGRD